jgi:YfiH family protein
MIDLPTTHNLTAHVTGELLYYTFPVLDAIPFVRHGFSTRLGGVSEGTFATMNLSFGRGDDPACARENFDRICAAIGVSADDIVLSRQEHHANIRNVTAADRGKGITRERDYDDFDGLLTDEAGLVLCTQYADCVPLLFADPVKRVVGTSHSGWKGTVQQIGRVTVERMVRDYGCRVEDIRAAIGPSIGPCCFEVDEPVYTAFSAMDGWDEACVRRAPNNKFYIDLWQVNKRILLGAGIRDEHLSVTDLCTRCRPDVFWSHRATGGERGSLAAFISLT